MKFKEDHLKEYLKIAPVPLAFERAFECLILSKQEFIHPILDVGCGDGIFAKILFDEKIDVGIDPLKHELESARTYDMYNELIEAFGNKIPKPDDYFATAFSNSVLEHIQDLDPVLIEVNRVLKKGGSFYVTIPTNLFDKYSVLSKLLYGLGLVKLGSRYNRFFNEFWKHFHYYSRKDWTLKFQKAGFKVKNIIEYGHKKDCLFNDAMVPVTLPNFFVKKIFNRFFLFPGLRRFYSGIWNALLQRRVRLYKDLDKGGLIFFHLIKE